MTLLNYFFWVMYSIYPVRSKADKAIDRRYIRIVLPTAFQNTGLVRWDHTSNTATTSSCHILTNLLNNRSIIQGYTSELSKELLNKP